MRKSVSRSLVSDSLWPQGLWLARLLSPWDFPGNNAGVGCHFLIPGIFLTWGSNLCLLHLLHCRQILYPLSQLGSLITFMVKVKLFLTDSAFGARVQACFWKLNSQYSLACVLWPAISFFKLYYWGKKMEQAMAPYSSTLAWKIPWTEEPGRLQSMGSLRVRHDWATSLSVFTFMHWRRKWQPTPVFLPGESQGRGSQVGYHLWDRTESDTTEAT